MCPVCLGTHYTVSSLRSCIIVSVDQLLFPVLSTCKMITSLKQVRRPSNSAFITLTDSSGEIVSRIDSSDERQVKFSGKTVEFDVHLTNVPFRGTKSFQLDVTEGVAIDEEAGNCTILQSRPEMWTVNIEGEIQELTDLLNQNYCDVKF